MVYISKPQKCSSAPCRGGLSRDARLTGEVPEILAVLTGCRERLHLAFPPQDFDRDGVRDRLRLAAGSRGDLVRIGPDGDIGTQ
jgi:hypothetical protein